MTASPDHDAAVAMREAIDVVEEAYEFMLAYAAQGRKREAEDESISRIRQYLTRFTGALDAMTKAVPSILSSETGKPFRARFLDDIAVTRSVHSTTAGATVDHLRHDRQHQRPDRCPRLHDRSLFRRSGYPAVAIIRLSCITSAVWDAGFEPTALPCRLRTQRAMLARIAEANLTHFRRKPSSALCVNRAKNSHSAGGTITGTSL